MSERGKLRKSIYYLQHYYRFIQITITVWRRRCSFKKPAFHYSVVWKHPDVLYWYWSTVQSSFSNTARILTHYPGASLLFRYSNSVLTLKHCLNIEPLCRFWSHVNLPQYCSDKKGLSRYWNVDHVLRHWPDAEIFTRYRYVNDEVNPQELISLEYKTIYSYVIHLKPEGEKENRRRDRARVWR